MAAIFILSAVLTAPPVLSTVDVATPGETKYTIDVRILERKPGEPDGLPPLPSAVSKPSDSDGARPDQPRMIFLTEPLTSELAAYRSLAAPKLVGRAGDEMTILTGGKPVAYLERQQDGLFKLTTLESVRPGIDFTIKVTEPDATRASEPPSGTDVTLSLTTTTIAPRGDESIDVQSITVPIGPPEIRRRSLTSSVHLPEDTKVLYALEDEEDRLRLLLGVTRFEATGEDAETSPSGALPTPGEEASDDEHRERGAGQDE